MHNTTRHLEMSHTKIYFFQANVATRHDILVNLFEAKVARNVATSTLRATRGQTHRGALVILFSFRAPISSFDTCDGTDDGLGT